MNIKDKVLELSRQYKNEEIEITEVFLTIITKYQLFEPCRYLAEDDEWVNVAMVSIEDESIAQAMSIKKSEIVMFGIFNREEVEIPDPKTDSEVFYQ
ncbi:MAG: hypothetical protein IJL02_10335 [Methanobrevibacter sp.]|uniref:hypothetical protein n=1 Tax=Methanobrevibacter sp. TaxID=66852 RepID=UPI0025F4EB18|nr:hypothetical protein [Methanobrevibacter sp.]MBQ6100241.1 hypothetical protein [Methanobrevibacter sp.]